MKRDKIQFGLIVLIAVGMVGIYYGAWYAYQQYKTYQAKYGSTSGLASAALGLFGVS